MVPVSDDYGGHEGARLRGPATTLVPRIYSLPVCFADNPEGLVTFTHFGLRKNHREGKPVSLRLRGREVQGTAVAVRDTEWAAERFASLLRRKPRDGRCLGVGGAGTAGRTWGEPVRFAARLAMVRLQRGRFSDVP